MIWLVSKMFALRHVLVFVLTKNCAVSCYTQHSEYVGVNGLS